jgi:pimeloyl-ACP methyl ester carboxylesterase
MNTTQQTAAESNLPVKRLEVNGTSLSYVEKGAGETVVFVHGAVSDLRTWIEQIEFFSENYRAVSYSRRYHGANEKPVAGGEYTRALHTADLLEFLKRLDAGRAHLVGHSYGASVALLAALEAPDTVASLTLGEPSPFPPLFEKEPALTLLNEQKKALAEALRLAENGAEEEAVREFLHTVVGVDVLELLPSERRQVVLENAGTLLPMLRTYYDSPVVGRQNLRSLNVPTLFITGELSPKIARTSNEVLAAHLPNARTAVLRGASHGLHIENPSGFNRLVLDFLKENRSSPRVDIKRQLYKLI